MGGRRAEGCGTAGSRHILQEVSVERIRAHISALEGTRHPQTAPAALERAAAHIGDSLRSLGYEMMEHLFSEAGREYRNIIATSRGTTLPEERVIVLAHYDTVAGTPGADDNASGVAVMLELATIFCRVQFSRSIQFIAVSLEESEPGDADRALGRRGSRALAAFARENGWRIEGVVVLEAIAFAGDAVIQKAPPGIPMEIPQQGNFIAVVGNEASLQLVEGFARSVTCQQIPLPYLPLAVPGCGELLPDTRRSDHASFWDQGYRAIMVTDTTNFRSPHYHRPSDTLATLNLPFAAEVCRAVAGVVKEAGQAISDTNCKGIS